MDKGDEPYLVIVAIAGTTLKCIEWDGSRYAIKREASLNEVNLSNLRITHYYGLSEVRYEGVFDYLVNRITGWPYLKIRVVQVLDRISQYFFNKKKLYTKQRMDLLKFLVARALDGKTDNDPLDLMTGLYTMRWYLHPQGERQQQKVEFYLDSLVETGELKYVNHRYVVTGKALKTIEEYEEQERRHTENVKMQWRMMWLTLAVALAAVVQAGLIKLPAILDLTSK